MATHSRIADEGWLIMQSVGDHSLEEGFADCNRAMDLARSEWERTGQQLHIFMDMIESEEQKDPEELAAIGDYFSQHLQYLTGRMAIYVTQTVHYGMSRLFSAKTEIQGLEVMPFYEYDEAVAWLQRPWESAS